MANEWSSLRRFAPGGFRSALLAQTSNSLAQLAENRQFAARVELLDLSPKTGVAWFPLVAPTGGAAVGCLARVEANDSGRPLSAEVFQQVRRCVSELVGLKEAPLVETVGLSVHGVPPDWMVSGRSMELAAVLALVGKLTKTATLGRRVVSGRVSGRDFIDPVGKRDTKLELCRLEAPGVEVLICATRRPLTEWLDTALPDGWQRRLSAAVRASPERRAREAWLAYEARDYPRARRLAASARPCTDGYACALAHWVEGACLLHQGDPDAVELLLAAVRWFRENRGERRYELEELSAFVGIALLDSGRAAEAVKLLSELLDDLSAVPERDRFADWARAVVKVAGTLRRCLVAAGRSTEAIALQETHTIPACALVHEEEARCRLDLAVTLAQAGERDRARDAFAAARDALPDTRDHHRATTRRFLELYEVRAELRSPTWPVAPLNWREVPQPQEVLEQLLAGEADTLDAYMEAELRRSRPLSYSQSLAVLRAGAVATVRWGRRPWVAEVVQGALEASSGGDATMRDALDALQAGDGAPFLRVAPY